MSQESIVCVCCRHQAQVCRSPHQGQDQEAVVLRGLGGEQRLHFLVRGREARKKGRSRSPKKAVHKAAPSSAAGMKRKSSEPTKKGKAKKEESVIESRCAYVPHLLCHAVTRCAGDCDRARPCSASYSLRPCCLPCPVCFCCAAAQRRVRTRIRQHQVQRTCLNMFFDLPIILIRIHRFSRLLNSEFPGVLGQKSRSLTSCTIHVIFPPPQPNFQCIYELSATSLWLSALWGAT